MRFLRAGPLEQRAAAGRPRPAPRAQGRAGGKHGPAGPGVAMEGTDAPGSAATADVVPVGGAGRGTAES